MQLIHGYGLKEVKKAVEMIDADAVAIHLNSLQEAVQPEGQTNFEGILAKICEIAGELDVPVIVKETGSGIAAEEAKKLEAAGVNAIDVGGLGGTSFAAVEYYRTEKEENSVQRFLGEAFWDWGIPTAASLAEERNQSKSQFLPRADCEMAQTWLKRCAFGGAGLRARFSARPDRGEQEPAHPERQSGYMDCSKGIVPIDVPKSTDHSEGDVHPYGNPHYMLDPVLAKTAIKNIYNALVAFAPEHQAEFTRNRDAYLAKLNAKIAEWEKAANRSRA